MGIPWLALNSSYTLQKGLYSIHLYRTFPEYILTETKRNNHSLDPKWWQYFEQMDGPETRLGILCEVDKGSREMKESCELHEVS